VPMIRAVLRELRRGGWADAGIASALRTGSGAIFLSPDVRVRLGEGIGFQISKERHSMEHPISCWGEDGWRSFRVLPAFVDKLEAVAVWIEDVGGVIARIVVEADTGCAVVRGSG